jgi:hypothetical protein
MKERYVKFCPKCGSREIDISFTPLVTQGVPGKALCKNCGYSAYSFPEVLSSEADKIKIKDIEPQKETDVSYGKFITKGYWKVLGLLLIIFGIIALFSLLITYNCHDTCRDIKPPIISNCSGNSCNRTNLSQELHQLDLVFCQANLESERYECGFIINQSNNKLPIILIGLALMGIGLILTKFAYRKQ